MYLHSFTYEVFQNGGSLIVTYVNNRLPRKKIKSFWASPGTWLRLWLHQIHCSQAKFLWTWFTCWYWIFKKKTWTDVTEKHCNSNLHRFFFVVVVVLEKIICDVHVRLSRQSMTAFIKKHTNKLLLMVKFWRNYTTDKEEKQSECDS